MADENSSILNIQTQIPSVPPIATPAFNIPSNRWTDNVDGTPGVVDRILYTHPLWQAARSIAERMYEPDPNFDWKSKVPGYERYVYDIAKIKSEKQWIAWKSRVDELEQNRSVIATDGTIWTGLVAGAVDPVNLLPIPVLKGLGFWKGAAYGVATNVAVQTPLSGIALLADPTTTVSDELENIAYSGVFGALLGGAVGALGKKHQNAIRDITRNFINDNRRIDTDINSVNVDVQENARVREELNRASDDLREPSSTERPGDQTLNEANRTYGGSDEAVRARVGEDAAHVEVSLPHDRPAWRPWTYRPRNGKSGLGVNWASRFMSQITGHMGIAMKLERHESQAISDFTHALSGDFGYAQLGNKAGVATAESAFLNSRRWIGMAADHAINIEKLWLKSIGYEDPGFVTTSLARVSEKIDSVTQKINGGRTDASVKLTEYEFNKAVVMAHRADRIEVPDSVNGKLLDEETKSAVRDAVAVTRKFYDDARIEAVKYGAIKTPEYIRRTTEYKIDLINNYRSLLNDIQTNQLPNAGQQRKAQLKAKIDQIENLILHLTDDVTRRIEQHHVTDNAIANTLDEIDLKANQRVASARTFINKVEESVQAHFDKMVAIRNYLIKTEVERGLLPDQKKTLDSIERAILDIEDDWTLAKTQRQKEAISSARETIYDKGFTPRMERFYTDLLKKIRREDIDFQGPTGEQFYINRIWDLDSILSNQEGLQRQFQKFYQDRDPRISDADALAMGADSVANIIKSLSKDIEGIDGTIQQSFRYSWQKKRNLEIPNEYVVDYIKNDITELVNYYGRDAGIGIEYARMFGDVSATISKYETLIAAADDIQGSYKKISSILEASSKDFDILRKSVQNKLTSEHPLTVTEQAIRTTKNYAALTMLGKVTLTSLPEAARVMFQHGFDGFKPMFEILKDRKSLGDIVRHLRIETGEALDLVASMSAQRMTEVEHGINGRIRSQAALAMERNSLYTGFNQFAEQTFYVLNGLAGWTQNLKTFHMLMHSHFMLKHIQDLANGSAPEQVKFNLASYGIDADMARRINDSWGGKTNNSGKLNLAQISEWEDSGAVRAFASALAGDTRRTVVTSGPSDKTLLQQGFIKLPNGEVKYVPITKLTTQLMTFGIAATQKYLVSGLQGRDAHFIMQSLGLIAMTYMSLHLRSSQFGKMEWEDQLAMTIDRSGVLAVFSDLNNMVESGTNGGLGVRPLFGLNPPYNIPYGDGGQYSTPFGPVGSKVSDVVKLFTDPYISQNEKYGIVRRSIMLNNVFYLEPGFKMLQRSLMD